MVIENSKGDLAGKKRVTSQVSGGDLAGKWG